MPVIGTLPKTVEGRSPSLQCRAFSLFSSLYALKTGRTTRPLQDHLQHPTFHSSLLRRRRSAVLSRQRAGRLSQLSRVMRQGREDQLGCRLREVSLLRGRRCVKCEDRKWREVDTILCIFCLSQAEMESGYVVLFWAGNFWAHFNSDVGIFNFVQLLLCCWFQAGGGMAGGWKADTLLGTFQQRNTCVLPS